MDIFSDGTIYCWGSSCKAPTETSEIGDTNSVYCWGKCELPSEVMQPDYDGEVYCWGNRCEPPTEKAQQKTESQRPQKRSRETGKEARTTRKGYERKIGWKKSEL
ncbi:hypothetical protein HRED_09287 [Candidatus Haloredivivus sp. G17]|nr:hypothetical protein HRED_09287 [Candidatus Haloredivivus sp. G17]